MKRALLFACCVALIGCGGSGGGSGGSSTLAGNWLGEWDGKNSPPPGDNGVLNITIESDGDVTGTSHNEGTGEAGAVSGEVDADGNVDLVIDYPSHDCTVEGNLTLNLDLLRGTLLLTTDRYNRTFHVYLFQVNLTRQN